MSLRFPANARRVTMSMFSEKLEKQIGNHPEWVRPLGELKSLLHTGREYTFRYLVQSVTSATPEILSLILSELTLSGELQRVLRVESSAALGGLGDFKSLAEIPDEIVDWRSQSRIRVVPEY